jgi:hypothetical protein
MIFEILSDLPKDVQTEIARIQAIPSGQRTTGEANYLTARAPYLTNRIIDSDDDGNILRASGLTVPDGYEGFAKGAFFIETDTEDGNSAVYQNIGDEDSCDFEQLGGGGDSSGIQTTTKTITSAELLDLVTNPVELIAAPGSNKFIGVLKVIVKYLPGETPYTNDLSVSLAYGDPSNAWVEDLFIFKSFNQDAPWLGEMNSHNIFGDIGAAISESVNQALNLANVGDDLEDGDGTMSIQVTYKVFDL